MMKGKLCSMYVVMEFDYLLIGGLWRKFPSKQTRNQNVKQFKVRNEKFRKNKLVFLQFHVVVGCRDQIPETKCWNEKVSTKKIFVHIHFLRICSIEMRFCGLKLLMLAYKFIKVLFFGQIEAAFIFDWLPNVKKKEKR